MTGGSADDTGLSLGSKRAENRHIYLCCAEPLSASGCCMLNIEDELHWGKSDSSPLAAAVD